MYIYVYIIYIYIICICSQLTNNSMVPTLVAYSWKASSSPSRWNCAPGITTTAGSAGAPDSPLASAWSANGVPAKCH